MKPLLCVLLLAGVVGAASPEQELFEALGGTRATEKGEFKFVRTAVAKFFEANHAEEIGKSFGSDAEAIKKFLTANPELRDTLYTAIDPERDSVMGSLEIFRDLWKLGPDNLKAHPQLAVALCVVWDQPKAVYDQTPHATRTKSQLPTGVKDVNHVLNWQQYLADEKALGGAALKLPWEFLVHVVNHKSVKEERTWAVKNYGKKRAIIGTIYPTVEYDTRMLQTKSAVCKLNGKDYDLPSILKYGGVCAMQADFAARVGKSVLIPTEYVGGEGASGVLHAWVMWAEVKSVTAEGKVDFTMQREGAYLIDNYYVGVLRDPKTGEPTTDRDITRRLAFVGPGEAAELDAGAEATIPASGAGHLPGGRKSVAGVGRAAQGGHHQGWRSGLRYGGEVLRHVRQAPGLCLAVATGHPGGGEGFCPADEALRTRRECF
jgi:hypothetical protein